jgi:hypothetical protein
MTLVTIPLAARFFGAVLQLELDWRVRGHFFPFDQAIDPSGFVQIPGKHRAIVFGGEAAA